MGLFKSSDVLLRWYEPRGIRTALARMESEVAGVRGRFYKKLFEIVSYSLLIVAMSFVKSYQKGLEVYWAKMVMIALLGGFVLSYLIEFLIWAFPREILVTKTVIARQEGQNWQRWEFECIERVELAERELKGKSVRVLLIYSITDLEQEPPEMIGVATKISLVDLESALQAQGVDVARVS